MTVEPEVGEVWEMRARREDPDPWYYLVLVEREDLHDVMRLKVGDDLRAGQITSLRIADRRDGFVWRRIV